MEGRAPFGNDDKSALLPDSPEFGQATGYRLRGRFLKSGDSDCEDAGSGFACVGRPAAQGYL